MYRNFNNYELKEKAKTLKLKKDKNSSANVRVSMDRSPKKN